MGNTKNMGNVAVTENVDDMEDTVCTKEMKSILMNMINGTELIQRLSLICEKRRMH